MVLAGSKPGQSRGSRSMVMVPNAEIKLKMKMKMKIQMKMKIKTNIKICTDGNDLEKATNFHGLVGCVGCDDDCGRVGLVKPRMRGVVLIEVAVM